MQRWEVSDHTAGGYCDPHKPEDCEHCRRSGNKGHYYLAADVDAREAQGTAVIKAQRERIAAMEPALRDCIAALEGYRRETGDLQQCDAERAARKLVQ